MRYRDLPIVLSPVMVLYCPICDNAYSANPGDYFMTDPDDDILCEHCEDPLELATRHGESFTPAGQLTDADIVTELIDIVRASQVPERVYVSVVSLLERSGKL